MKQLTGLDAAFLHVEDKRVLSHVASVMLLDPATRGEPITSEVIRDFIAERLHLLPAFRRRLVTVPLGIDLPYWVEDPDLDLDFHVRGIALPRPGTDRQLAAQVARLVARPLDRAYPLWEIYLVEGLADGRVALVTKMHHAAIDGESGMRILTTVLSADPAAAPPPPVAGPAADPLPSELEMLLRGWTGLLAKPGQAASLMLQASTELGRSAARLGISDARELAPLPTASAPRLPFNRTLTARRNWAFGSLDLTTIKAVKNAYGVTVNDVVLAICSGALRRWLLDHDALPDVPVRVMVPVSMRSADSDAGGNQVAEVVVDLPTHLHDPRMRLGAVHDAMTTAKEQLAAVPARLLLDLGQLSTPMASEIVARTAASVRLSDHVALPFNLVISNVPGPRERLYYAGARLDALYPASMITDGMGLNITVQSYRDHLDFGLVSTPQLVPDLWDLMDHLRGSLDELVDQSDAAVAP